VALGVVYGALAIAVDCWDFREVSMPTVESIKHEHIVKALEQLRKTRDIPPHRGSTKYDLIYRGERYPPKYVVTLSKPFAAPGIKWKTFLEGGKLTNLFLESRGFKIDPKSAPPPDPPKPRRTSVITLSRVLDPQQLDHLRRTAAKVRVARRLEAALVVEYRDWLKSDVWVANYQGLRCDAYEKKRNNLIEAKSSNKREYIRMAVGQLLDYAFLGKEKFDKPNMAILLREKPEPGILTWLDELKIKVI